MRSGWSQWRKVRLLAAIAALGLFFACDNEDTFEAQISQQVPQGFVKMKVTVASGSNEGAFTKETQEATLECAITVVGTVKGEPFTKVYTIKLKATGPEGAKYKLKCDDPILMHFPADAFGFAGTFDNGMGVSGPLVFVEGLTSMPTGPGTTLDAKPGYQIVLLALPDGVPPGTYDMSFSFGLAVSRRIAVQAVITGFVQCGDELYYPPIVPCGLKSFSDIPFLTIPVSPVPVKIFPPLDDIPDACEFTANCGVCTGAETVKKAKCKKGKLKVIATGGVPGDSVSVSAGCGSGSGTVNGSGKATVKISPCSGSGTVTARWTCGAIARASYICS